jgi:hypothetical protein
MDTSEIQAAFDDVFDQAIVFHSFADYMRDYDVFVYAAADPRTGIRPAHLRYRFMHCVRATVTSALSPDIWRQSPDERLVDYAHGRDLDGYVWGVKWQELYPGMKLVPDSADAQRWSRELGLPFREAIIRANGSQPLPRLFGPDRAVRRPRLCAVRSARRRAGLQDSHAVTARPLRALADLGRPPGSPAHSPGSLTMECDADPDFLLARYLARLVHTYRGRWEAGTFHAVARAHDARTQPGWRPGSAARSARACQVSRKSTSTVSPAPRRRGNWPAARQQPLKCRVHPDPDSGPTTARPERDGRSSWEALAMNRSWGRPRSPGNGHDS